MATEESTLEWSDLTSDPEFQDMDSESRESVRTYYVDNVLDPAIKDAGVDRSAAITSFFDITKDDVYTPVGYTPEDAVPEVFGSKELGAGLVGMGHGMSAISRGMQQMLGVNEVSLAKDQESMNELYESELGTSAFAGEVVGMLAEPFGFLFPSMKGATLTRAALTGAGVGGVYGSAVYVDEEAGATRMTNALIGGVSGGLLSPALITAGRKISQLRHDADVRFATEAFENYEKRVHAESLLIKDELLPSGLPKYNLLPRARQALAERRARGLGDGSTEATLSQDDIAQLMIKSGRVKVDSSISRMRELEAKTEALYQGRGLITKGLAKVGKFVSPALSPVATTIRRLSEPVFQKLRKFELTTHVQKQKLTAQVDKFLTKLDDLPKVTQTAVSKALINGDSRALRKLLPKDVYAKYEKHYRPVFDNLHKKLRSVGYDIPKIPHYAPRIVVDGDILSKSEHSIIQLALKNAQSAKAGGAPLTDREIQVALSRTMQKNNIAARTKTGSGVRTRTIDEVDDAMLPAYATPREAAHSYISSMIDDVYTRRFFGTYKGGKKALPSGVDVQEAVGDFLRKQQKLYGWGKTKTDDITLALSSRFVAGIETPHKWLQHIKNVSYGVMLGNPVSAVTQFGDLALTAARHGIRDTVMTLMKPKGRDWVSKEQLGIVDAIEDMVSTKGTKRFTNWALKWGGFSRVDRLGKEISINTALRRWKKAVQTKNGTQKLQHEWGGAFGAEFNSLASDLRAGKLTDNVKLLLWHELSDMQPISLSEMPKLYLNAPNGRIVYMLKTFTIKQLDIMRRGIWNQVLKGDRIGAARNATKFASLFVLANASTGSFKAFMQGKEIDFEDQLITNVWTLTGINRYTVTNIPRIGLGTTLIRYALPPASLADDAFRGVYNMDVKRMVNLIPPFGRLAKGWIPDKGDAHFNALELGEK